MIQPLATRPDNSARVADQRKFLPRSVAGFNAPPNKVNESDFFAYPPFQRVDRDGLFYLQGMARADFVEVHSQSVPAGWTAGVPVDLLRLQVPSQYAYRKFYLHALAVGVSVANFTSELEFSLASIKVASFKFQDGLTSASGAPLFPFIARKLTDEANPYWCLADIPLAADALLSRYRAAAGNACYMVASFPTRMTLVCDSIRLRVTDSSAGCTAVDTDAIVAFGMACYSQTHPF